jgi:hypothetical protein
MNYTNTIFTGPLWEPLTFWEFILLATSIVLLIGFLLSIVFILWGWLLLILSWGKEEKTKPAINTIRYAVLWIFITVWAIFIAPIIWNLLGMWDLAKKYFSVNAIYDNISTLAWKLFWDWTITDSSNVRYINNSWNSNVNIDDLDF